jgi:hypothetical protein
MKKLIFITGVKVNMTAEDWELYTMPGAKAAAQKLNRAFAACVRKGMSRNETETAMYTTMRALGNYGAADSEPYYHLRCLLTKVYGEEK